MQRTFISAASLRSTPPTPSGKSGYIPALDGVRGLAILAVVFHHFAALPRHFFPGWAGVDLFFVLSGYLITGRLLASRENPRYFSHFYRNRILRIWPLYFLVLAIFYIFISYFVSQANRVNFAFYHEHWKSFVIFAQNWTFIRHGWPRDLSLMPLWSIAVEEQFYLFWPLMIYLVPTAGARLKAFIILLLTVILARTAWYFIHPEGIADHYFNSLFRMDSFLAGSLLCQVHALGIKWSPVIQKKSAWFLLILLTTGILAGSISPYKPFMATVGFTILAALFVLLLQAAIEGRGYVSRLCKNSFLRYCGKISYCLYLVHTPIILILGTRFDLLGLKRWPEHPEAVYWISRSACLAISFLFAIGSFYFFESWFLKLKARPAAGTAAPPFLKKS